MLNWSKEGELVAEQVQIKLLEKTIKARSDNELKFAYVKKLYELGQFKKLIMQFDLWDQIFLSNEKMLVLYLNSLVNIGEYRQAKNTLPLLSDECISFHLLATQIALNEGDIKSAANHLRGISQANLDCDTILTVAELFIRAGMIQKAQEFSENLKTNNNIFLDTRCKSILSIIQGSDFTPNKLITVFENEKHT